MVQDCPICLNPVSDTWGVCSPCGHPLHASCMRQLRDNGRGRQCPVCNAAVRRFVRVYMEVSDSNPEQIQQLEASVEYWKRKSDYYMSKTVGLEVEVCNLKDELEKKTEIEKDILELQDALCCNDVQLTQLEVTNHQLQFELSGVTRTVALKNAEVCDLKVELEEKVEIEKDVLELQEKLCFKDIQLAQLEEDNRQLQRGLTDFNRTVALQEEHLEEIRSELNESKEKNRHLEEELTRQLKHLEVKNKVIGKLRKFKNTVTENLRYYHVTTLPSIGHEVNGLSSLLAALPISIYQTQNSNNLSNATNEDDETRAPFVHTDTVTFESENHMKVLMDRLRNWNMRDEEDA